VIRWRSLVLQRWKAVTDGRPSPFEFPGRGSESASQIRNTLQFVIVFMTQKHLAAQFNFTVQ